MLDVDLEGVRGVVYDLDGTLLRLVVDWEAVATEVEEIFRDAGEPIDGDGVWELLERAHTNGLAADVEAAIARHEREGADNSKRLPGADHLESLDLPAGVCSLNCEAACREALKAHGLDTHVDVVVGRDTVGARKPDPTPLLAAAEGLGLDPADVLFIGDSESDEVTADRAGTRFSYVGSGPTRL